MGNPWGSPHTVEGTIVGRETKVGLLVGVIFIGLFGLILGGRAGSATEEHAPLPVGESEGHRTLARTIHRTIDPFAQDRMLVMPGPDATPASDVSETGDEQRIRLESELAEVARRKGIRIIGHY